MSGIKRRMERIERSEVRRDLRFVMYKDEYEALVAGTADAPDLRKLSRLRRGWYSTCCAHFSRRNLGN
jgi:hypothetical protein